MLCFGHKIVETCWVKCSGFFMLKIKLDDCNIPKTYQACHFPFDVFGV